VGTLLSTNALGSGDPRCPGVGTAQFGDQSDHAGVDADYQPIGSPAFVVPAQQPAGAAGGVGHVRPPLVQDQFEAGAQPVPALLNRALRLLISEGGRAGGKGGWATRCRLVSVNSLNGVSRE
jgi:hypothetical protein